MPNIKNNPVLSHFRNLMKAAITLKEKFDRGASDEVIQTAWQNYQNMLDELRRMCPQQVLQQGNLLKHSDWLASRIKESYLDECHRHISAICLADIFYVEECYLHYLVDVGDVTEKNYEWGNLHQTVRHITQAQFNAGHYTDAVEAAFKEMDMLVSELYQAATGKQKHGVSLMHHAFGISAKERPPVLQLMKDVATETGRNIQEGYTHIFAGAMQAIGSPKAHTSLDINPDEAWEMIVLASHLVRMLEKHNQLTT